MDYRDTRAYILDPCIQEFFYEQRIGTMSNSTVFDFELSKIEGFKNGKPLGPGIFFVIPCMDHVSWYILKSKNSWMQGSKM